MKHLFFVYTHIRQTIDSMLIKFDPTISSRLPRLRVVTIEATVSNHPTDEILSAVVEDAERQVVQRWTLDEIKSRPAIAATRQAYKTLGKDPNRYRPAADALCRRVVRGLGLYRVNALVDIINVLSLLSGYSIGGFDADKFDGDVLTLGVGQKDEPYEGIGRGLLNIEHLPVYRDNTGGVGTPTSDNERTKLDLSTTRLFMTVNIYGLEMDPGEFVALTRELLSRHCGATDFVVKEYTTQPAI